MSNDPIARLAKAVRDLLGARVVGMHALHAQCERPAPDGKPCHCCTSRRSFTLPLWDTKEMKGERKEIQELVDLTLGPAQQIDQSMKKYTHLGHWEALGERLTDDEAYEVMRRMDDTGRSEFNKHAAKVRSERR